MKIIKYLQMNPLFANMDENEINNIFSLIKGKIVKYPKGRLIYKEGVRYNELFVILEGEALTFIERENGEKEGLSSIGVGDMVNELEGFIKDKPLGYSVVVLSDVTILHLDIQSILNINSVGEDIGAKFLNNIFAYYSDKIINLTKNKDMMAIKSMRTKVSKLIFDKYTEQNSLQINMGMNRNDMAEYLSVSRPSMSREMIRMREEGIIKFHKEDIEILDLECLKKIIK